MYKIREQSGELEAYVTEFIADTEADMADVPTKNCAIGSTCLVIETSNVYMLNNDREWKVL